MNSNRLDSLVDKRAPKIRGPVSRARGVRHVVPAGPYVSIYDSAANNGVRVDNEIQ